MQDLLNINTVNRKEAKERNSLYFVDGQHQKYKQAKHISRFGTGANLRLIDSNRLGLTIILKRQSSNSVVILLFQMVVIHPVKKVTISSVHSDLNHKIIFKLCGNNDSHLLLYQECNAIIEIRRLLSLKREKFLSLENICNALEIGAHFSEMKVCLDAVYVPHLSAVVLCLNFMLVLCKDDTNPSIIYRFEGNKAKDRFINLQYNCPTKTILAETLTSIILFELGDDGGVSRTQVLRHPYLKSLSTRIIDWDPKESILISALVTNTNRENIYLFKYANNRAKVKGLLEAKRIGSAFYSKEKRQLLYINEEIFGSQSIRSLYLSSLDDYEDDSVEDEEEKLLEGELVTHVPEVAIKAPRVIPMYQRDTLFIRFLIF